MARMRYKLTIAYDGTAYCGWQRQVSTISTVQQTVEKAASYIANHPVTVLGSSRTDSGVHAQGQVAEMTVETQWETERLRMAINSRLPPDILIRTMEPVDEKFNIRKAKSKRYRYLIWADHDRPVFYRHYVYHYWRDLDISAMQEACRLFEGRHDFIAFRGRQDEYQTTIRDIFHCHIYRRGPIIIFAVEGNGFLYHMVRTMVGTVLEIGHGQGKPERVMELLVAGDRRAAGPCAPASGLCLQWIRF
ncbi:MAG: tRNA pseudouridine(38-40) synthase TruA [Planctomycetes bacterium]|nr:tRNA pseudouridine(38-40) synthase TruA [Planctomycetota bacterium]